MKFMNKHVDLIFPVYIPIHFTTSGMQDSRVSQMTHHAVAAVIVSMYPHACAQAEAERKRRVDLIMQIRAMESVPVERFKEFDRLTSGDHGLLIEMSVAGVSMVYTPLPDCAKHGSYATLPDCAKHGSYATLRDRAKLILHVLLMLITLTTVITRCTKTSICFWDEGFTIKHHSWH